MTLLRHLPRFRKAYDELDALAARESWPRARIEAHQLERLNRVWRHAVAFVPHYRMLAADRGLPQRFDSLAEFQAAVPVLTKEEVQREPRGFLSERREPGGWQRTGGSTGAPMSAYWGAKAHREMMRLKYRFLAAWGVDIFDRQAYLWGQGALLAPGLSGRIARLRQPVEDWLRQRIRLSVYHLGHDDLRDCLRRIAAFRPASIYGFSSALYLLALEAEAVGFHCDALRLVTLSGEPAFGYIVEAIRRVLKVPTAVEYGSTECGYIAGQGPEGLLRVREDAVLVETLPRDDGRYEIVVTVLTNPSFPLLRYALADVTDAPLERPCQGFAVLKNVSGRNSDFIVTRSGRYVHASRFDALFKFAGPAVRRFRVRQDATGSLCVAMEVDGGPEAVDREGLVASLGEIAEGYPVRLEIVAAIPQTPAGKHRLVVSELARRTPAGVPAETVFQ